MCVFMYTVAIHESGHVYRIRKYRMNQRRARNDSKRVLIRVARKNAIKSLRP